MNQSSVDNVVDLKIIFLQFDGFFWHPNHSLEQTRESAGFA